MANRYNAAHERETLSLNHRRQGTLPFWWRLVLALAVGTAVFGGGLYLGMPAFRPRVQYVPVRVHALLVEARRRRHPADHPAARHSHAFRSRHSFRKDAGRIAQCAAHPHVSVPRARHRHGSLAGSITHDAVIHPHTLSVAHTNPRARANVDANSHTCHPRPQPHPPRLPGLEQLRPGNAGHGAQLLWALGKPGGRTPGHASQPLGPERQPA